MPRIDAPTVAEHHARQRRALLDAARALLAETEDVPSMAAVGARAKLARTSVYQYFASADELLAAVVADVFPDWSGQVRARVAAEQTPALRVWAYVEATVDLFSSREQVLARTLTRVVGPEVLRGPMQEFHAGLQVPLREALADLGESEPDPMAALVDAVIVRAAQEIGHPGAGGAPREVVLSRVRRLLGGYLGLEA
ncbi:TetR family transcriptional regulator [Nocardioides sp. GY 10113]|uniref:TetR/AcrR family transcriptional regulator n=1 Tax=Nocardioides sp. GY 10113 TaxID=2569761 RepID=UPI0010A8232F|nr:TetR family transcriptional regulator [Nocardioides sp. GY 10113]TIC87418.1 TetR family transcriptional regulator [Nocardioides sp. GY 10113]